MRVALYLVVPAVTIGASAVALGTIAAPRTLVAARVWGGPTSAAGSVRIECVRRAVGVDDHVALADVEVEIDGARTKVACDDEGYAEVRVAAASGARHVRVRGRGTTLAEGEVSVGAASWETRAVTASARLRSGGKLSITAFVDGGALAMGQRGRVILRTPEDLRTPTSVRVAATGGDVRGVSPIPGGLAVDVVPTFPTASLEVARSGDAADLGGWEAQLPVAPAAIVVEDARREGDRLVGTVRSPTERPRAHVALQDVGARVAAVSVPLRPDGRGGSFGELSLEAGAMTTPAWLVVGTDPALGGGIAWPVGVGEVARDGRRVPDARWLDGMTPMHTKERARSGGLTRAVGLLVGAGALLEALLLVDRARRSRTELAEHVAKFAEDGESHSLEERSPVFTVVVALAAILFGFAAIGVVFLMST